eukprot:CAMPEP_0197436338 /NCGR_PEP_ID=MMETSP1175-20131217/3810_1 /TAXON_ID=1003142 /ORGANISM="Triceratium dubium, Strain CCMP147" /LENGTH=382 /DNA_ID=CAMNT_0042965605 /DNA_START=300 /DNA_END=1448 /DNA_ORIENTATION=-
MKALKLFFLLYLGFTAARPDRRGPKLRPSKKTAVRRRPHPSRGNGYAYSHEFRIASYRVYSAGMESVNPMVQQLRSEHLYPAERTMRRYRQRLNEHGHFMRFVRQGNQRATAIVGGDLMLLAQFRILFPKARIAEVIAYLFNARGRFYHPSQISRAEDRLGLTRKRGSTTARQARLPRNLQWRWNYWNLPYPYGMVGIRRRDIIDLDECGVFLESANRNFGKAAFCRRVREVGPYGHSQKLNIMMAISGESGNPSASRWIEMWNSGGTTITRMVAFIQKILQDIGPGMPGHRRVFTMDNLAAHSNNLVVQLIHAAGHRVVFRAPYYPVDGPIEYLFNTLQQGLTFALYRISNDGDLCREVRAIIGRIVDFVEYFIHCGFRYN